MTQSRVILWTVRPITFKAVEFMKGRKRLRTCSRSETEKRRELYMTDLTTKRKRKFIGTFGKIILKRKKEEKNKNKALQI